MLESAAKTQKDLNYGRRPWNLLSFCFFVVVVVVDVSVSIFATMFWILLFEIVSLRRLEILKNLSRGSFEREDNVSD